MTDDGLSKTHFRTVLAEIQGRFFSANEAEIIKAEIDRHTVTDPEVRAVAAKTWSSGEVQG